MSNFSKFRDAITEQFNKISKDNLFFVNVEKDVMWETYLTSFPVGTNEIFRVQAEHDCSCCRQFIKAVGNAVAEKKETKQKIMAIIAKKQDGELESKSMDELKKMVENM